MQPSDFPAPFDRGSGLPLPAAYLGVDASSVRSHLRGVSRPCAHPRAHVASESDHRVSVAPESTEEERGPPRCLDRPLAACRGRTLRRVQPPLALLREDRHRLRGSQPSRHPVCHDFVAAFPTAHSLACLRIADRVTATIARLATGWAGFALRRAGLAPAGRRTEFHELIASHSFRTSLAWSHWLACPSQRKKRDSAAWGIESCA